MLTDRSDVVQRIKIYSERGNQAYPLSELQAAVLLPQLERLAERNERRLQTAVRLLELCREFSVLEPVTWGAAQSCPSFYKVGCLFGAQCVGLRRDAFLTAVRAEGVALDEGFRGFALRSGRRCRKVGALPNSREAAQHTVLLHHPILLSPPAQVDRVAKAIERVVNAMTA